MKKIQCLRIWCPSLKFQSLTEHLLGRNYDNHYENISIGIAYCTILPRKEYRRVPRSNLPRPPSSSTLAASCDNLVARYLRYRRIHTVFNTIRAFLQIILLLQIQFLVSKTQVILYLTKIHSRDTMQIIKLWCALLIHFDCSCKSTDVDNRWRCSRWVGRKLLLWTRFYSAEVLLLLIVMVAHGAQRRCTLRLTNVHDKYDSVCI